MLFGDFNAITKNWTADIQYNKYDFSEEPDDIPDEIFNKIHNQDTREPDTNGNNLLEFCKAQNIHILNGRVGQDKNLGKFITRNNTVIDYCIANPELFTEISYFEIA